MTHMNTSPVASVPRWGWIEFAFTASQAYTHPLQEVRLHARFTSPSERERQVEGFWDGGDTWRVRFDPDEEGEWHYQTIATNADDTGLHMQPGAFHCTPAQGMTRFQQHGSIRLSEDRRSLAHADGTPFFFMGDTAWNALLCATPEEFEHYLSHRLRQQFTAVQWVATQWLASPGGDRNGDLPYTGREQITVNPAFFQRLDQYIIRMAEAGLLSVPVMLWAASWSTPEVNASNPGFDLPEDQAILLARYMLARWNVFPTLWILPGDGHYDGEVAERWKRIGRAVFEGVEHAPATLHPGGMRWPYAPFQDETWLDVLSYQSGHGYADETFTWLVYGPPATEWQKSPARPVLNLEPAYENHIAYQTRQPHDDRSVRQALYWSLLVSPTAGVTYGGHGIWGWDDGTAPPVGHPNTGIPLPWQQALTMPGAEQIPYLVALFTSLPWQHLRPAPDLLHNPDDQAHRYIVAARAESEGIVVVYLPGNPDVQLRSDLLGTIQTAEWFNPRTGERQSAAGVQQDESVQYMPPNGEDWVLLLNLVNRNGE